MSLSCILDIHFVHMHAICVPKGVTLLEFDRTSPEAPGVQQPEPEAQEVQLAAKEPGEEVVECPDHKSCNFVKGKPCSIISLLIYEMQLSTMLYLLLH
jgi:hypothetical protein